MKRATLIFGPVAILLGGLWLLRGFGLVPLRPILCFAQCAPLQRPLPTWAALGAVALALGGVAVAWSQRRDP